MTNLWSGRFDGDPDADVFQFGASFRVDRRLFEDDVTGSLAWCEALAGAGVLTADDAAAIRGGLQEILARGRRDPAFVDGPDEDVHAFVERQLIERIGDIGKRLHTGRSRNDQVSTDLRLYLRRTTGELQEAIRTLIAALADQAASAGEAMMPAYTHMRRAQPVLVAHFLLSHAAALRRDDVRFEVARDEADVLPLGSGAVAGSSYPIDAAALSAGRPQQHGRRGGPRLRGQLPARLQPDDGAPEPPGRGSRAVHGRGVRDLRAL
jgi:argininosuccinate lyase